MNHVVLLRLIQQQLYQIILPRLHLSVLLELSNNYTKKPQETQHKTWPHEYLVESRACPWPWQISKTSHETPKQYGENNISVMQTRSLLYNPQFHFPLPIHFFFAFSFCWSSPELHPTTLTKYLIGDKIILA